MRVRQLRTADSELHNRAPSQEPVVAGGKIDRQEIAAIVDRFLAGKRVEPSHASPLPPPVIESEAGSMYAAPAPAAGRRASAPVMQAVRQPATNGAKAVDFVSEDDVRRAIQKGEKIYINAQNDNHACRARYW